MPSSFQYPRLRARLLGGVALIIALVMVVVCWQVRSAYSNARTSAQAQTESFVRAIEAHVAYSIELVDLSLTGFAQSIAKLSPEERSSPDAVQRLLLAQGAAVSANFWILFVDADGIGVAATRNLPVEGVNYQDRDYFRTHVLLNQGRFIGPPMMGRVSKTPLFTVSHRVEDKKGKFLGVIVALIDARAFARVFESARFNEDVLVSLNHRSGRVIARAPEFASTFGADMRQSLLFRHLRQAENGTFEGHSTLDQKNRIYSYRAVPHLPLVVSVAISSDVWNETLARSLFWGVGGILLIAALLLASTRLVLRGYSRLAQSEDNYRVLYTEVQQAEQKLASSEQRLRTITDNAPALIAYIDQEHMIRFCNGTFEEWIGLPPHTLVDRPIAEVMGAEHYARHRVWIERALAGEQVSVETEATLKGTLQCLHTTYVPDRREDGTVAGTYTLSTDITALKEKEKQLEILARIDPLTGLPNRRELDVRLNEALHRSRRLDMPLAVMFLDIDRFKSINDQYGHATGDLVLQQFAQRLQRSVRATDTVARLAGDEFVVVLEQLRGPEDVRMVAEKIVKTMQAPILAGASQPLALTSIGISYAASGAATAAGMLAQADEALYEAKTAGRNTYVLRES